MLYNYYYILFNFVYNVVSAQTLGPLAPTKYLVKTYTESYIWKGGISFVTNVQYVTLHVEKQHCKWYLVNFQYNYTA